MAKIYTLVIEKRAERELRSLPTEVERRINAAIADLASNPRPAGCKKLASKRDAWRIRVGDYRVIYEILEEVLRVLVVRIGHRRDIYR